MFDELKEVKFFEEIKGLQVKAEAYLESERTCFFFVCFLKIVIFGKKLHHSMTYLKYTALNSAFFSRL